MDKRWEISIRVWDADDKIRLAWIAYDDPITTYSSSSDTLVSRYIGVDSAGEPLSVEVITRQPIPAPENVIAE